MKIKNRLDHFLWTFKDGNATIETRINDHPYGFTSDYTGETTRRSAVDLNIVKMRRFLTEIFKFPDAIVDDGRMMPPDYQPK